MNMMNKINELIIDENIDSLIYFRLLYNNQTYLLNENDLNKYSDIIKKYCIQIIIYLFENIDSISKYNLDISEINESDEFIKLIIQA